MSLVNNAVKNAPSANVGGGVGEGASFTLA